MGWRTWKPCFHWGSISAEQFATTGLLKRRDFGPLLNTDPVNLDSGALGRGKGKLQGLDRPSPRSAELDFNGCEPVVPGTADGAEHLATGRNAQPGRRGTAQADGKISLVFPGIQFEPAG